ncbi:hypothetical protein ABZ260_03940 [Streptosporangium sp. NPDC006013]
MYAIDIKTAGSQSLLVGPPTAPGEVITALLAQIDAKRGALKI